MSFRRLTIRDIATAAGVHFTTVSRALSGHPSIPPATRDRIRELAKKMGYRPDPMLSALMAYRSSTREHGFQGTLAWLTSHEPRHGLVGIEIFDQYHAGAAHRAEELGYRLEEYWTHAPNITGKRLSQILMSRNIRGVLVAPLSEMKGRIDLDWSQFAGVRFGYTLENPQLHTVASHTFHAIVSTINEARALGYRRLGLAMSTARDRRIFKIWSGAFLTSQLEWPASEKVPLHMVEAIEPSKLLKWYHRHLPDLIISPDLPVLDTLQEAGIRMPQDVGFATPSLTSHPLRPAGIDENSFELGAAAVNMLVGMLHRNEAGIPRFQNFLLIKGSWTPGRTLARQTKAAKAKQSKR